MKDIIVRDAVEFGVHVKMGGWRLGLLVARNVEKGAGGPRTGTARASFKVTAREFAEASGIGRNVINRHLDAWNEAADEGAVPHAEDLHPGAEPNIEFETLPDWNLYYSPVRAIDNKSPERRKAIEAAASEAGTTPDQVNKALSSKPALAAAIKADPEVRAAAAKALDEHYDREDQMPRVPRRETPDETARDVHGDSLRLITRLRAAHRALSEVLTLAQDIRGPAATELRDAVSQEVEWIRGACDVIEVGVNGGPMDEQIAALLDAEGGR